MGMRGIRGATTVEEDSSQEILTHTKGLMEEIIKQNCVDPEDVAAVFITVTHDLQADFPAKAVRSLPGWDLVPLMCSNEIPVSGSLDKCIRVMILTNTAMKQNEVKHVFLRGAMRLRPDLVRSNELTAN
ncbi:MAG TPA: chorismate mutase [Bacillota bacterium]|nr:chorismate mutase [Bacillota bacterium]